MGATPYLLINPINYSNPSSCVRHLVEGKEVNGGRWVRVLNCTFCREHRDLSTIREVLNDICSLFG